MTIYHFHHIIPRHMGGTDDPSNLVKVTVEQHAEAHRKLYEQYGLEEDRLAWLGLAGIVKNEEKVKLLCRMAGNKTVSMKVGIHDPEKIHLKQEGGRKGILIFQKLIENSKWMNNGKRDKRVTPEKINSFLSEGWIFGRLFSSNKGRKNMTENRFWINKNGVNKRVPKDQVAEYIKQGWSSGSVRHN